MNPGLLNRASQLLWQQEIPSPLRAFAAPLKVSSDGKIYKYLIGVDKKPVALDAQDIPKDPFVQWLVKQATFPLSLGEILQKIEQNPSQPGSLGNLQVYHVAEGGQIPWSEETAKVNRTFRLVIALQGDKEEDDVFISSGIDVDATEDDHFLQIMSWDGDRKGFNFYQRDKAKWIWAGNSHNALEDETRGQGPFCGHINGAPNMKELKIPWSHWRSQSSVIREKILPSGHSFVKSPLFTLAKGAEDLEARVRVAISRWNAGRIEKNSQNHKLINLNFFTRQLLSTTIINLTSSTIESSQIKKETIVSLPVTFFVNSEAFEATGLELEIANPKVQGELYLKSLQKYGVSLITDNFTEVGDTHFAFLVTEPAFEDTDLLQQMINQEIISARLAASLLMVDFSNPTYSVKRASLLKYMPSQVDIGNQGNALEKQFLANIQSTTHAPGSPESEFLKNWQVEEWQEAFPKRIQEYLKNVQNLLKQEEGMYQVMELADYRKSEFKKTKLAEFDLTFSQITQNKPTHFPLEMTEDGRVISSIT